MRIRAPALAILVGLLGCPSFPADGPYRCERNTDCTTPQVCSDHRCVAPCALKVCDDLVDQCGPLDDGCGGTITCACAAPKTCSASGTCTCTPNDCASQMPACGQLPDGCGGSLDCGCFSPTTCGGGGTPGMCGCTPATCATLSADCGDTGDGCGGTLACGTCTAPAHCGGGGAPNVCGRPAICDRSGALCDYLEDNGQLEECGQCSYETMCGVHTPNQCGRPALCGNTACGFSPRSRDAAWCGGCPLGQACVNSNCEPTARPYCWSDPESVDAYTNTFGEMHPSFVVEAGAAWLYGASYFWADRDPGCNRHARVRLTSPLTIDAGSFERVPTTDLDDIDTSLCMATTISCLGWNTSPRVRADGLEMFFSSSFPCADWADTEIYVSARATTTDAWGPPVFVDALSTLRADINDGVSWPVLMPDRRTLLYSEGDGVMSVAVRPTTRAGDTSFMRAGRVTIDDDDVETDAFVRWLSPLALSCDQAYLIYIRVVRFNDGRLDSHEPRIARIASLDPPVFVDVRPYTGAVIGEHARSTNVRGLSETPDCSRVYYGTPRGLYYRRRVPCP